VREVVSAGWQQDGDAFVFEIAANAFLYHMVRRLVNLQVEIGQGKVEPEVLTQYLHGGKTDVVQGLAPAHGLFLVEVRYEAR
jgi:tRNA pseudouridine38-40 synthase